MTEIGDVVNELVFHSWFPITTLFKVNHKIEQALKPLLEMHTDSRRIDDVPCLAKPPATRSRGHVYMCPIRYFFYHVFSCYVRILCDTPGLYRPVHAVSEVCRANFLNDTTAFDVRRLLGIQPSDGLWLCLSVRAIVMHLRQAHYCRG